MNRLIRHFALVAAAAALTFTLGCGSSGNSYVKIIHASADAPNVDASVNGNLGFTNLAFGIVSRAAPTLNLFATGLPISILFGLLVIIVTLPVVESGFVRLLGESFMLLRRLSGG